MRDRRLLGLASALLVGCVAPVDEGAAVDASTELRPELAQMNDVSVMLPLPSDDAALVARLGADSPARGGALLPREVYEGAFGPPGTLQAGGTPGAARHEQLKLVSFRLDPCFGVACESQIRLVLQPLRLQGGEVNAKDEAVHAFYRLSRPELAEAVASMIALRLEATGEGLGPLAPHPLAFDDEGRAAIEEIVATHAGAENLSRITIFTTSALGAAWNFSGFDLVDGHPERVPMAELPTATEVVAFFRGFGGSEVLVGDPAFAPASLAGPQDNLQALGSAADAERATEQERQDAFDALTRIDDPTMHHADSTDCASCHAADPIRRIVGEGQWGLSPRDGLGFEPDGRYLTAEDLAATSVDPAVNLHMFSYAGRQPSIHRRTIHETAAVVAYVNEHVLD